MAESDGLHDAIARRVTQYHQSPEHVLKWAARELQQDLLDHPHGDVTHPSYVHLARKIMEQHSAHTKGRRVTCACQEFSVSAATAALRRQAHQGHVAERIVALLA